MSEIINVPLLDIANPKQWPTLSRRDLTESGFPVYGANGKIGFASQYTHEEPTIIIGCRGSCGEIHVTEPRAYVTGNSMALDRLDNRRVDQSYLVHFLRKRGFADIISGSSQPQITRQGLSRLTVPLPPLGVQRRIAAILDKADGIGKKRQRAIALVDNLLKSVFLEMFGDPLDKDSSHKREALGELARIETGKTPPTDDPRNQGIDIPFVTPSDLGGRISTARRAISRHGAQFSKVVPAGSTMVCCIGATIGKMGYLETDSAFNQQINSITWGAEIDPLFGYVCMTFYATKIAESGTSTTLPILKKSTFSKLDFPVPKKQQQEKFATLARGQWRSRERMLEHSRLSGDLFDSLSDFAFRGGL